MELETGMRPGWAQRYGMTGAAALVALSLGGCDNTRPDDRQDAYKQVGSLCSFMAPTVSGTRTYVPSGAKEAPESATAYPDPETPFYCDRPLAETIYSAIELTNYRQALDLTGLMPFLRDNGPYTVFAIPNNALQQYVSHFPAGLNDPGTLAALKPVLAYSIVRGKWSYNRLQKAVMKQPTRALGLQTMAGVPLTVSLDQATGKLTLSNGAGVMNRIWVTGVPQSNGVLYFTQGLLTPVFPPPAPAKTAAAVPVRKTGGVLTRPLPPLH